eukprot:jgi/Tetstr1/443041/TSEL_031100.t1
MLKFEDPNGGSQAILGLSGFSAPYKYGYLNLQAVMLLSQLGIPDDVFINLQCHYFHQCSIMCDDEEVAFKFLMTHDKEEEALAVAESGITGGTRQRVKALQRREFDSLLKKAKPSRGGRQGPGAPMAPDGGWEAASGQASLRPDPTVDELRLRILVDKSRFAYCVSDSSAQLQYGSCFFQPTIDGTPTALERGRIVMIRNPCYHVGDIRVLTAVDVPELRHLQDCLVLPVNGPRPHMDEAAGGDVDGDTVLVIWDPALVPEQAPAAAYPAAPERPSASISQKDMITYFAKFNDSFLGRLNKLYIQWADLHGADCEQCKTINALFARGVDAVKSGEQQHLPARLILPTPGRPRGDGHTPDSAPLAEELPPHAAGSGRIWRRLLAQAYQACLAARHGELSSLASRMQQGWVPSFAGGGSEGAVPATAAIAPAAEEESEGDGGQRAGFDMQAILRLIETTDVCLSEYGLLVLVDRWCRTRGMPLLPLVRCLDFERFSSTQKLFAQRAGIPRELLYNALNQSTLLSPDDIRSLHLHTENLHWKLLAGCVEMATGALGVTPPVSLVPSGSAIDRFHASLQHAMTEHTKKLLGAVKSRKGSASDATHSPRAANTQKAVRPNLALWVRGHLSEAPGTLPGGCTQRSLVACRFDSIGTHECPSPMVSFVFAGSTRAVKKVLENCQLDIDGSRLQIYREHKTSRSFLWLKRSVVSSGAADLGRGGRQQGRRAATGGRGDGRGQAPAGAPRGGRQPQGPATGGAPQMTRVPAVLLSVATIEMDKGAYAQGIIPKVNKVPVAAYELYVVSSQQPLRRASLAIGGLEGGGAGGGGGGDGNGGCASDQCGSPANEQAGANALVPLPVPPDEADLLEVSCCVSSMPRGRPSVASFHNATRSLTPRRIPVPRHRHRPATRPRHSQRMCPDKLPTAMALLRDTAAAATPRSLPSEDRASVAMALLRSASRLQQPEAACSIAKWLLDTGCGWEDTFRLCRVTRALHFCPEVGALLWEERLKQGSSARGSPAPAPPVRPEQALELAVAAIRCAPRNAGADALLQDILDRSGVAAPPVDPLDARRLAQHVRSLGALLLACVQDCGPRDPLAAVQALAAVREAGAACPPAAGSGRAPPPPPPPPPRSPAGYFLHWAHLVCLEAVGELRAGLEALEEAEEQGEGRLGGGSTVGGGSLWQHVAGSLAQGSAAHGSALARLARREAAATARRTRGAPASPDEGGTRALSLLNLRVSADECEREGAEAPDLVAVLTLYSAGGGHLDGEGLRVGDVVRLTEMADHPRVAHPARSSSAQLRRDGGLVCVAREVGFTGLRVEAPLAAVRAGAGEERLWRLDRLGSLSTFTHTLRALEEHCRVPCGHTATADSPAALVISSWVDQRQGNGDGGEGGAHAAAVAEAAAAVVVPQASEACEAALRQACNDSQATVGRAAATSRLVLIHGPPGTGKVMLASPPSSPVA